MDLWNDFFRSVSDSLGSVFGADVHWWTVQQRKRYRAEVPREVTATDLPGSLENIWRACRDVMLQEKACLGRLMLKTLVPLNRGFGRQVKLHRTEFQIMLRI